MHYQCLIVDDEKELAQSTSEYFNLFDVKTEYVLSYEECLTFFEHNTAELILLDINLKDASGFTLCKKLRQTIKVPILFISARDSEEDVLIALNIGGDDYIQKPYKLNVLLAKVRVVLKRQQEGSQGLMECYKNGNLMVDYSKGKVYVNQQEIALKGMEYKLLTYLIQNKGRIIGKEEFFEQVWKDSITGDGTLNVHIRHLREKIEEDPNVPTHIKTVWGRGYCYEE